MDEDTLSADEAYIYSKQIAAAAEALMFLSDNSSKNISPLNENIHNCMENTEKCIENTEEDVINTQIPLETYNIFPPPINYNSLPDKKLNTLTGIPNSTLLNKLTAILITKENQKLSTLTVKEQIIMTMMRLKLNLKFAALSIFFGISGTTCKNIFIETLINLSRVLQSCIVFPSKDSITKSLPRCFQEFKSVRIVLDCTEIPLGKTKCLKCNINTYSTYKCGHTVKYMIGISPDGMITFISLGYGGRVSDKIIVNQSGILEYLEPYVDSILVDKGFLIEEECEKSAINLIRPPFVKKGNLTSAEAHRTRSIAKARVHVERCIQRLKIFEFLSGPVPWTLVPFMDSIMIVIAGITNLSKPILSDKRF